MTSYMTSHFQYQIQYKYSISTKLDLTSQGLFLGGWQASWGCPWGCSGAALRGSLMYSIPWKCFVEVIVCRCLKILAKKSANDLGREKEGANIFDGMIFDHFRACVGHMDMSVVCWIWEARNTRHYSRWPSIFVIYFFFKFYGTFAKFELQSIARHFPQLWQVTNRQFNYITRAFLKSLMVYSLSPYDIITSGSY